MSAGLQIYLVGGAVRDALLGEPAGDRDWVVVGATPQDLLQRGYTPVGRDFPVFLHPRTHEEYALARTERKSGHGYSGFHVHAAPDVTLEDDLKRRDLTINAIAVHADLTSTEGPFEPQVPNDPATWLAQGRLTDPLHGLTDLRAGVLRHASPSFVEDPVRILRLARLAARWPAFSVAPATQVLLRQMVQMGEVDHLVPERVWAELARGLMAPRPSRMFQVLRECGALARLVPELDRLAGVPQRADYHPEVDTWVHVMMVLDTAAAAQASLPVRLACLLHDLGKGTTPADILPRHIGHEARGAVLVRAVVQRLRVPREAAELAELVAREHGNLHASGSFGAAAVVRLLQRCDAWRKPDRLCDALLACVYDARGRLGHADDTYPQRERLLKALRAATTIDTKSIAAHAVSIRAEGQKQSKTSHPVAAAIHAARVQAVAAMLDDVGRTEPTAPAHLPVVPA